MAAGALRWSLRSGTEPGKAYVRALCTAALLGMAGASMADPGDTSRISDLAAAARHDNGRVVLGSEVSAERTRLGWGGATAFAPDGRPMNEVAAVQMRLLLSHGRTTWGVGVGTIGWVQPAHGTQPDAPLTLASATPTVSVGMRYRLDRESALFADALGARALPPDSSGGYVQTKVGMEWKPAKSTFGFEGGALGIHFDSGYRLSVKARRDGLGVYLRGQF
jgi:hypothetical protein